MITKMNLSHLNQSNFHIDDVPTSNIFKSSYFTM